MNCLWRVFLLSEKLRFTINDAENHATNPRKIKTEARTRALTEGDSSRFFIGTKASRQIQAPKKSMLKIAF